MWYNFTQPNLWIFSVDWSRVWIKSNMSNKPSTEIDKNSVQLLPKDTIFIRCPACKYDSMSLVRLELVTIFQRFLALCNCGYVFIFYCIYKFKPLSEFVILTTKFAKQKIWIDLSQICIEFNLIYLLEALFLYIFTGC